jgi:hypothetical protein
MVRTNATSDFVDIAAERGVISWFNRKNVAGLNRQGTGDLTTSSETFVEMSTTLLRAEFITWADDAVQVFTTGSAGTATAGAIIGLGIDNTTLLIGHFRSATDQAGAQNNSYAATIAEGYHFGTVLGRNTAASGTLTLFGTTAVGGDTAAGNTIQVLVRG